MFSSRDFINVFEQGKENIEIVKWIGKFSLLQNRLRNAWMDLLPTSSSTEQKTTHEKLFPFSGNLKTVMFTVASDLNEAQRERLTSSLSLSRV